MKRHYFTYILLFSFLIGLLGCNPKLVDSFCFKNDFWYFSPTGRFYDKVTLELKEDSSFIYRMYRYDGKKAARIGKHVLITESPGNFRSSRDTLFLYFYADSLKGKSRTGRKFIYRNGKLFDVRDPKPNRFNSEFLKQTKCKN